MIQELVVSESLIVNRRSWNWKLNYNNFQMLPFESTISEQEDEVPTIAAS